MNFQKECFMNVKSKLFYLCSGSFFISSLTIFIIPAFPRFIDVIGSTILACVFWLFFITGIASTVLLSKQTANKNMKGHSLRVFRFFRTKHTKITDTVMFIAAITIAVMGTLEIQSEILYQIIIFLFLFSAEMHCVFNLLD